MGADIVFIRNRCPRDVTVIWPPGELTCLKATPDKWQINLWKTLTCFVLLYWLALNFSIVVDLFRSFRHFDFVKFLFGFRSQSSILSAAIRTHSPAKPILIFVSSRRQTRLTALDLIAFLASEDDPKQWLHQDEREVRIHPQHCFFFNEIVNALHFLHLQQNISYSFKQVKHFHFLTVVYRSHVERNRDESRARRRVL